MARKRMLSPDFFTHERLTDLQPLARLLFAALWTIADKDGRLEERQKKIKLATLPFDDVDIDELLAELADRSGLADDEQAFIVRYSVGSRRYIAIPNFTKWQKPHPREADSVIPPPGDAGTTPAPVEGNDSPGPSAPQDVAAVELHGSPWKGTASPGDYRPSKPETESFPSVPKTESSPSESANPAAGAAEPREGSVPIEPEVVRHPGTSPPRTAQDGMFYCDESFTLDEALRAAAWCGLSRDELTAQFEIFKNFAFSRPFADPVRRWKVWVQRHKTHEESRGHREGLADAARRAARESGLALEREGDADIARAIDERKRRREEAERRASA